MSDWRESILEGFIPNLHKLTLVADPDGLLTEETLSVELRQRGFDLIEFNDSVEFRYAYETQYRTIWDSGEYTDLVVVLRLPDTDLESLPYDLLQAGRRLSFNLGDLFPNLSYPIIERLEKRLLDDVFTAQEKFAPSRLGDNATKDFILEHVFSIRANLINSDVDLLKTLLRLHYGDKHLPKSLGQRFFSELERNHRFTNWPLDLIIPNAHDFFEFLQERWPLFLEEQNSENQISESRPYDGLKYSGPEQLPFGHDDIRIYVDDLFVDGLLKPVRVTAKMADGDSWMRSGIVANETDDRRIRVERLIDLVNQRLDSLESHFQGWLSFASDWAELSRLVSANELSEFQPQVEQISAKITNKFSTWLSSHYSSLANIPPTTPAMLHHVPRLIAREREDHPESKIALIVVDGLSMTQWLTLKQSIEEQSPKLKMDQAAIFAWIPTLTSVSRQSIFAGKPPIYFSGSINNTSKEESLWKQFWANNGVAEHEVAYQRSLGSGDAIEALDPDIDYSRIKALGLVVDTVDKIMHGMQLGAAGMHSQVSQWGNRGFLPELIDILIDYGFEVWLTSDHGNIECHGQGRPSEGVIAETRGERARVYSTAELRAQVSSKFTFSDEWDPIGLPNDYYPLVIGGKEAFGLKGESIVGHGGISIEEVIVPLIKFNRVEK